MERLTTSSGRARQRPDRSNTRFRWPPSSRPRKFASRHNQEEGIMHVIIRAPARLSARALGAAAALVLTIAAPLAQAQAWKPEKHVEIIVGGGAQDRLG